MQLSNYYAFLALDLANRRAAEADAYRLASLAQPRGLRAAGLRRAIARVALAVARAADEQEIEQITPAAC